MAHSRDESMTAAHTAWREGRLIDAEAGYRSAVRTDPQDWVASFQLAWLDAAFGRLSPDRARSFDRPMLSQQARRRVDMLVAQTASLHPLEGALAAWDIDALLVAGRPGL